MLNFFKRYSHFPIKSSSLRNSYSQYGEDQIILALLNLFNLQNVNFLDIGANDPYIFSNTALLYEEGINGVNIEPDPDTFSRLKFFRTKDICLNIGIGQENTMLNYFRFTDSVYNTFCEREYNNLITKNKLHPLSTLNIEVKTYHEVVESYLKGLPPTILFIDTEGLDELIIDSIDFSKYAPLILCIETFSYGKYQKDHNLVGKIIAKNYTVHADTFVNTIFIHNSLLPYPTSEKN